MERSGSVSMLSRITSVLSVVLPRSNPDTNFEDEFVCSSSSSAIAPRSCTSPWPRAFRWVLV